MNEKSKNENIVEKSLKVDEIIRQTFHVYRTGFKQFMTLSLISMVASLFMYAVEIVLHFSVPIAVLILIISLGSIYFTMRANAGFFLLTQNILQGEKRTIKESYKQTKDFAGTFFVVSLMYGLILVLPALGIGFSYELISNNTMKFVIIGLLIIPLAFLATRYFLAIPSALLFGDSGELESSRLLVKGDFWQVLAVIVLTQGIIFGISLVIAEMAKPLNDPIPLILIAIVKLTFLILTGPIYGIASTAMYIKLNQIKAINVLSIEG